MSRINYNHLRYFRAVAHEGHLTRAAELLNLSQSALSVQIKKLEDQLGHPLFDRIGKQLVLTEAGRIALDHADAIFATGDELLASLSAHGPGTRVLRVGALATLSRNFQIGFLGPLLGAGNVEIVLRSGSQGELLAGLADHALDLVLTNTAPPRDAATPFRSHPIADQAVSLVGHPNIAPAPLPALVAAYPLVLPSLPNALRLGFDALCDRLGLVPRLRAEVDDMAMLRLFARETEALCLVPPIVVRDELAAGTLIECCAVPQLREQFLAITARRRFPNPLLAELLADPSAG